MTDPASDSRFMRRALELAERGRGQVAPNPLVGAVVVRDGEIVGEGWHRRWGGPHAEVEALRAAGEAARGATMYVTLEPCNHHGKTPPCTQALLDAGIAEVVYAASDPNPEATGGGARLEQDGVSVRKGVEGSAAASQNAIFFRATSNHPLPWVEMKLALSLDGKMADASGASTWITGEEARAEVHRLRAGYDAIAVGIGTVLADDPLLTVRTGPPPRIPPARIVFDRELRIPDSARLVQTLDQAPVIVVAGPNPDLSRADALASAGIRVVRADSLHHGLSQLRDSGIQSLFVEGGPTLAGSVIAAGLVDRLTLFIAPVLLGPDALDPFAGIANAPLGEAHRWNRVRTEAFGQDTMIVLER